MPTAVLMLSASEMPNKIGFESFSPLSLESRRTIRLFVSLKIPLRFMMLFKTGILSSRAPKRIASSAEFVGGFWLWKVPELMIQRGSYDFKLFEAVCFSHGQFRLVVETLHNP